MESNVDGKIVNHTWLKYWSLFLLSFGESLVLYTEIVAAKNHAMIFDFSWLMFSKLFLFMTMGGAALLLGYMYGYKAFKDIWIVSVASVASILISGPMFMWFLMHQLPTVAAGIGFMLGVLGLFLAIFF